MYKHVFIFIITMVYIQSDEQLIPVPPNDLTVTSEKIDERVEFFGHVLLNISWNAPQSTSGTS